VNLAIALTIGALVTVAVLQLLDKDVVRVVIGIYIFWNAANIFIVSIGKIPGSRAPLLLTGAGPLTDPLVQALVLTAIVITLGFVAFLVALNYWLAHREGSIDLDDFRRMRG